MPKVCFLYILYSCCCVLFIVRFIALEVVRAGGKDSLHVLITSHQVFFLRNLEPHAENIILQVKHSDYSQCRNFEKG